MNLRKCEKYSDNPLPFVMEASHVYVYNCTRGARLNSAGGIEIASLVAHIGAISYSVNAVHIEASCKTKHAMGSWHVRIPGSNNEGIVNRDENSCSCVCDRASMAARAIKRQQRTFRTTNLDTGHGGVLEGPLSQIVCLDVDDGQKKVSQSSPLEDERDGLALVARLAAAEQPQVGDRQQHVVQEALGCNEI